MSKTMTEDEIMALEGDKLAFVIATDVMGWHREHRFVSSIAIMVDGAESDWWANALHNRTHGVEWRPNYDYNHAAEVIAQINKTFPSAKWSIFHAETHTVIDLYVSIARNQEAHAHAVEASIPLAVCRVALLAMAGTRTE